MTRDQIKAELRRSAVEDESPRSDCRIGVFCEFDEFRVAPHEYMSHLKNDDCRTFFLLVAAERAAIKSEFPLFNLRLAHEKRIRAAKALRADRAKVKE